MAKITGESTVIAPALSLSVPGWFIVLHFRVLSDESVDTSTGVVTHAVASGVTDDATIRVATEEIASGSRRKGVHSTDADHPS